MVKARIVLIRGLTHSGGPCDFKHGKPQILTNAAHIRYYQNQGDFNVTILSEDKPPAPKPTPKAVVVVPEVEPVEPEGDPEDDDEGDPEDDAEGDPEDDAEGDPEDDAEGDPEDDDGALAYMEKDLKKLKKPELKSIADELGLSTDGTVKELIQRIVEDENA